MVETIPPFFLAVMLAHPQNLIRVCICLLLATATLIDAAPSGFLEGHLRIISRKEVELADETPSKMRAENYIDFPLVILSRDKKTELAHLKADEKGNYRIALPPGDYVLDLQNSKRHLVRATAEPFTVVANQTVRVDMAIDTGIR